MPTTQTSASSSASAQQRLERLRQELIQQHARSQHATLITAGIGAVSLVLLGGYFYYAYAQLAEFTEPKQMVDVAQGMLEDNLPEARQALEKEIVKQAPVWAEKLSQQAQQGLPVARKKLEEYALTQAEAKFKETKLLTEEQFREFLGDHRALLEAGFKDLANNSKLADDTLADFEEALNATLKEDLKTQSAVYLETLNNLHDKVKRLELGQKLSQEEQLERRIVMLCRRMQTIHTGTGVEPPAPRFGTD